MIRCRNEVSETNTDKKQADSRELPIITARRLSFNELLVRDGDSWRRIETAAELRRVGERVQRELRVGELTHFYAWASGFHGAGLARSAGMPVAPLRAQWAC